MALIEIQNFSYTYHGESKPVLRDIDLSIEMSAFVVIIGKSGSGKSTFGKALAGFLFQDEIPDYIGSILINGDDMTKLPIYNASQRVAYVQQNPEDQFCTLTVMDEIAFGLENFCLDPQEIEKRIEEVLDVVKGQNLKDRDLATLSGGEKQKIAIASMLALEPDVLILDEPTSNLDPVATEHVFETLYQIRKTRNLTVIIIEHKLSQLLPFEPDFFILNNGEIRPAIASEISEYVVVKQKSVPLTKSSLRRTNTAAMVNLSQISVMIDGKPILNKVDLNLMPGEFVALMGPNGSGKSTLLETIMGFHPIQSGSAAIFGESRSNIKTSALVKDIGYIFQNPDHQLFTQSVWDEATFTSLNLGLLDEENQTRAADWLELFGLQDRFETHPQRLSYGEKRRLNLMAAMLHNPRLLLIDELLIGQDLENAQIWMTILNDYTKDGHTVLLVNHHADLTRTFCDRVLFMDHGQIILDQPTSEAFSKLDGLGYRAFLPKINKDISNA